MKLTDLETKVMIMTTGRIDFEKLFCDYKDNNRGQVGENKSRGHTRRNTHGSDYGKPTTANSEGHNR